MKRVENYHVFTSTAASCSSCSRFTSSVALITACIVSSRVFSICCFFFTLSATSLRHYYVRCITSTMTSQSLYLTFPWAALWSFVVFLLRERFVVSSLHLLVVANSRQFPEQNITWPCPLEIIAWTHVNHRHVCSGPWLCPKPVRLVTCQRSPPVSGGRWSHVSDQLSVVTCQRLPVSDHLSLVTSRWSHVSDQLSVVTCQRLPVSRHFSVVTQNFQPPSRWQYKIVGISCDTMISPRITHALEWWWVRLHRPEEDTEVRIKATSPKRVHSKHVQYHTMSTSRNKLEKSLDHPQLIVAMLHNYLRH